MILPMLSALLDPLAIGFFTVSIFWYFSCERKPDMLLKAFLAFGAGSGLISILYFLTRAFQVQFYWFIYLEISAIILTGALFIAVLRWARKNGPVIASDEVRAFDRLDAFSILSLLCVAAAAIAFFIHISARLPHGDWDAWAIWNLRARFLFRSAPLIANTFSKYLSWSHPDYPLLVPSSIARFWQYLGSETQIAPIFFSAIFSVSTAGLLSAALLKIRGKRESILSAIVLIGTPMFMVAARSQYADMPLSYFMLASFALVTLYELSPDKGPGLLLLSGLMAGLAGWTKNEGLLFAVLFISLRFVASLFIKEWRRALKDTFHIFLGMLPVLLVLAFFKLRFAPPNDILSQSDAVFISKLKNFSLYLPLLGAMLYKVFTFSGFGNIGALPVLGAYLFLAGIKIEKNIVITAITIPVVFALLFIAYFFLYLTCPYDPFWTLSTSMDRLIAHAWPSLVFLSFLIIKGESK